MFKNPFRKLKRLGMSDEQIQNPDATNPETSPEEGGEPSGLLASVDALELAKLREQAAQFEEMQDRYLRTTADFQNFRKRMERETEERARRKVENLLHSVLGTMDELDRACANAPESPIVAGVRMIREILNSAAAAEGVREIPSVGRPFDPKLHEAISSVASDEPAGTVILEQRRGYVWGDRVLRPSQVVVATNVNANEKNTITESTENHDNTNQEIY
ncbi:MAG: nucleotide exchange factor GrpE [Planctomycetota bacterium]